MESAPLEQNEAGVSEDQTEPVAPDQGGDQAGVSEAPEQAPGSTDETVESGQNPEASIISSSSGTENSTGVENAPLAGEAKLNPDEPHPGEDPAAAEKQ